MIFLLFLAADKYLKKLVRLIHGVSKQNRKGFVLRDVREMLWNNNFDSQGSHLWIAISAWIAGSRVQKLITDWSVCPSQPY